jgi:homocysteine S-methyltransferase
VTSLTARSSSLGAVGDRRRLPHQSTEVLMAAGGIETTLSKLEGITAPHDAVVALLDDPQGERAVRDSYRAYGLLSREVACGFVLDTPTRRASPDWADALGYDHAHLAQLNARAAMVLHEVRSRFEGDTNPILISGAVGPRPTREPMTAAQAQRYHATQISWLEAAGVDLVTSVGVERPNEVCGIVHAATSVGLAVAVSLSIDHDVRTVDGADLGEAIGVIDETTGASVAYFIANVRTAPSSWEQVRLPTRVLGVRIDASEAHDDEPTSFGSDVAALASRHRQLTLVGGGAGTDERHIAEIARALGGRRADQRRGTDAPRLARSRRGHR